MTHLLIHEASSLVGDTSGTLLDLHGNAGMLTLSDDSAFFTAMERINNIYSHALRSQLTSLISDHRMLYERSLYFTTNGTTPSAYFKSGNLYGFLSLLEKAISVHGNNIVYMESVGNQITSMIGAIFDMLSTYQAADADKLIAHADVMKKLSMLKSVPWRRVLIVGLIAAPNPQAYMEKVSTLLKDVVHVQQLTPTVEETNKNALYTYLSVLIASAVVVCQELFQLKESLRLVELIPSTNTWNTCDIFQLGWGWVESLPNLVRNGGVQYLNILIDYHRDFDIELELVQGVWPSRKLLSPSGIHIQRDDMALRAVAVGLDQLPLPVADLVRSHLEALNSELANFYSTNSCDETLTTNFQI